MVLAVGIGVDYAFYIYNRLQLHLAHGQTITKAVEYALLEVGVATIFTAITLAVGVATWASRSSSSRPTWASCWPSCSSSTWSWP